MRHGAIIYLNVILAFTSVESFAAAPTPAWPAADAKKVDTLKAELKQALSSEFTITVVGPWVIATDMEEKHTGNIIKGVIDGCAAPLQRQLFTKTARTEPVKVYLFKDADSYNLWHKKLFGEKPSTIFGYFSRAKNALVMNIGTGGGTLVHEMVHAMAEADFPDIPAWLNEGLGSLYEASRVNEKGRVLGLINWRLKGLKADLEAGTASKLNDLIGISDTEFYGERSSSNYATMRYFMQWMQNQGKLEDFYVRVRDNKDSDPKKSLCAVFADKMTVDEIEKKVFDWAKTLKFGL